MKLAILGSGMIVNDALYAIEPLNEIEKNAILVREHSLDKGKALSEKYNIKEVYTDYDELLEKSDIDTVYVGLVNNVHYEYTKRALEKGKHVILEKPLVGTFEEAKELMDLAKNNNLYVLEAITVLHNEVINQMKEALPKLGHIKMMLANYSQYSSRYDKYLRGEVDPCFDPECLGGALRDINIYNIHYVIYLLGMPKEVTYYPNDGFNGIDTSGVLVMKYDDYTAVCTGAKDSDSPSFVSIQGEKGYMRIDGKPNVAPNLTVVLNSEMGDSSKRDASGGILRAIEKEEFIPSKVHHRMTQEFKDFARIIDNHDNEMANMLMEESLQVMKVIGKTIKCLTFHGE